MKKYLLALSLVFIAAPVSAADEWLSNEVLQQLHELRNDIRGLKEEVTALKKEVVQLKSNAAKGNRRAAAPQVPTKAAIGRSPVTGSENAKVAVLEFTDFQCPYCGRNYQQSFAKIMENYVNNGKVRYVAKDFPLSFHKRAMGAAIAAQCSGKQGKYWEMHNALFENQNQLGDGFYNQQAASLGLDMKRFERCLKDPQMEKSVKRDQAEGESYGVQGTPAFFIGRIKGGVITDIRRVSGAQPYEQYTKIIDMLLM